MFGSTSGVKAPLKAVGSYRKHEDTKNGSPYHDETVLSYIPAELAERMNVDRNERMRTKVLMAAGLNMGTDGSATAKDGPQTLLLQKIQFHRAVEDEIFKFVQNYARLFYEHALIDRKQAVKRAAAIGNYLLDEVQSALEGDDTDRVLDKAPNISQNISGLAKLEKPSQMDTKDK